MSKRRNPKKEKALRNQAYARKFRKKRSGGQRFFRRNNRNTSEGEDSDNQENSDSGTSNSYASANN
jgi:hypothetical protein